MAQAIAEPVSGPAPVSHTDDPVLNLKLSGEALRVLRALAREKQIPLGQLLSDMIAREQSFNDLKREGFAVLAEKNGEVQELTNL